MASDPIALPAMELLAGGMGGCVSLIGVFTQPDRPKGRGMKLAEGPVKLWAKERGLPVLQPGRVGESDLAWLRDNGCQLIIVMAYGQLLRQSLLDLPEFPPLNLHGSILPELRGAAPINGAIAEGREETGVTLMRMVKELDAGPMADLETTPVSPDETYATLHAKLAAACPPLLQRALPRLLSGELEFREQDHEAATFTRIIDKSDGAMDFSASAQTLASRLRALTPWPGCYFERRGERIKVGEASVVHDTSGEPGQVLGTADGGLLAAAGQGALCLRKLQRPGGRMLPAPDFLRGCPILTGESLASAPMRPLVADKPFPRRSVS